MSSVELVVLFYFAGALALVSSSVRRILGSCFFYQDRSRSDDYAYLDALRGLAALSVILLHYYLWNPESLGQFASIGWIADGQKSVGVFFVLSSFLIWRSLRLDQIGSYAIGRILRIYPLHIAIILFLFLPANAFFSILYAGSISTLQSFWHTNAAFLKEALLWNVFSNDVVIFNGVAWSIVLEMKFYLAAPLLKYVNSKFPRLFVAFLISISAGLILLEANETVLGITSSQLPWLKFFIAGIFLAIFIDRLVNTKVMRNPYVSGACILAAMCMIDLDFNNIRVISRFLPLNQLTFSPDLAIAVCFLIVGLRANAYAASLLSIRPVRFLGVISYSFYLSQLPILQHFIPEISASTHPIAFVLLFVIPFHVVISALLFLVVETPFLMLSAWMKTRSQEASREYPAAEPQYGMTGP
jgi:peptidoglycan/LPS O-acetylase OafA/YrhL